MIEPSGFFSTRSLLLIVEQCEVESVPAALDVWLPASGAGLPDLLRAEQGQDGEIHAILPVQPDVQESLKNRQVTGITKLFLGHNLS
jgi:hypothetical protein